MINAIKEKNVKKKNRARIVLWPRVEYSHSAAEMLPTPVARLTLNLKTNDNNNNINDNNNNNGSSSCNDS